MLAESRALRYLSAVVAPIRIANCSGFFGDRLSAAREMVERGPRSRQTVRRSSASTTARTARAPSEPSPPSCSTRSTGPSTSDRRCRRASAPSSST